MSERDNIKEIFYFQYSVHDGPKSQICDLAIGLAEDITHFESPRTFSLLNSLSSVVFHQDPYCIPFYFVVGSQACILRQIKF